MADFDKDKKISASKCEGLPDLAAACPHHSELVYYFCELEEPEDKKGDGGKK